MKVIRNINSLVGQTIIYSKEYYDGVILVTEDKSILVLKPEAEYDSSPEIKIFDHSIMRKEFLTPLVKYPDKAADYIKDLFNLGAITQEDIEERRKELKKEDEEHEQRILNHQREQYEILKKKFEGE